MKKFCKFLLMALALWPALAQAGGPYLIVSNPPAAASVAWDLAPGMNYRLWYGTDGSRLYSTQQMVGPTNFVTMSNLVRGVTYYVAVTAIDQSSGLESPWSSEVSYTPKAPPFSPANVRPPLQLSIQYKPGVTSSQWADAGLNFFWGPDGTNDLFRLQISNPLIAQAPLGPRTAQVLPRPERPPLPELPAAQK